MTRDRDGAVTYRAPLVFRSGAILVLVACGALAMGVVLPGRSPLPHPTYLHVLALLFGLFCLRLRCVVSEDGIEVVNPRAHEWLQWPVIESISTRRLRFYTRVEVALIDGSIVKVEALETVGSSSAFLEGALADLQSRLEKARPAASEG